MSQPLPNISELFLVPQDYCMYSTFLTGSAFAWVMIVSVLVSAEEPAKPVRIGMIGLDTSHCLAFAELFNKQEADPEVAGFRVVLVYPKGSPDIESSVKRVPDYTVKIKALGVPHLWKLQRK